MNWELQCFALEGAGIEVNNYTVNLTNARVVDINGNVLNNKMSENAQLLLMEQVNFVYQKIKWTWIEREQLRKMIGFLLSHKGCILNVFCKIFYLRLTFNGSYINQWVILKTY